jgi:hypothetical protein
MPEEIRCLVVPLTTHPFAEVKARVLDTRKAVASLKMSPTAIGHANTDDISSTPGTRVTIGALQTFAARIARK